MTLRRVFAALVTVLATLGGAAIGSVTLLAVGASIGGNYATQFEFANVRGYEAMGKLGFLVGLVAGGALGALLARRRASR